MVAMTAHDTPVHHARRRHVPHPAFAAVEEQRLHNAQLRLADKITAFAGSMMFVYIHVVIFAVWCGTGLFGADPFPFNFLTMTVSLEAIFLSTFVMIGQNRQADYAQAKASHDFKMEDIELHANTELTRAIHDATMEIHQRLFGTAPPAS
jgi:uncharacterized membrane protein